MYLTQPSALDWRKHQIQVGARRIRAAEAAMILSTGKGTCQAAKKKREENEKSDAPVQKLKLKNSFRVFFTKHTISVAPISNQQLSNNSEYLRSV